MTVTDKPVIDFDHWSPQYRANWQQIAAEFHATGHPLAWSPHHDGFWVLADWDAVQHVASDWETFTSVNDLDGTENGGLGQVIPRQPYRLFLGESDPPLHTGRRKLEAPFFTPKALRRWRPVTRRFLAEAINSVIETGRANLIDDVLVPTTARTTLHVLGYDTDAWRDPADVAHKGTFLTYDDPEYPHGQQKRMREAFRDMLTARSKAPTGDLISALATGLVEGSPLSLDEGESMMNALVFGGFDTTVSTTASALIWMDQHPHEAARIREDAAYRANAIEEFLRVRPPVTHVSRTAVKDTELLGQRIAKGERVMMWLAGTNRDPKHFPNPDVIDLERANARDNVSFSAGNHRCLGSPLAKVELNEMLGTIGVHLADMKVDQEAVSAYPTFGAVIGYTRVPVTFTPGTPIALDEVE
jgi:cytochrome P450